MPRPGSSTTDELRAELAAQRARLSEIERRIAAVDSPPAGSAARPGRGMRVRLVVALATLALAMPMLSLASDTFLDVPDSNIFHEEINRLYGARVTGGCSAVPLNYCPDATVTRGQMAAFLNRGLGRAAYSDFSVDFETDAQSATSNNLATVTVTAGNVGGGSAVVVLWASMSIRYDDSGNCPCDMQLSISDVVGGPLSLSVFDTGSPEAFSAFPVNSIRAVVVETGIPTTFTLSIQEFNNAAGSFFLVEGTFGAMVFPFGGTGQNVEP